MKMWERLRDIETKVVEMRKKMHALSGLDEQFQADFDSLVVLIEDARAACVHVEKGKVPE